MEHLLQQGIEAARAGRREEARDLLMKVVEADERNEQAWLWLAGLVEDPDDMRTCLENVLELNPDNAKARQGLAWIEERYGPRAHPDAHAPAAAEPVAPSSAHSYTGPTSKLTLEGAALLTAATVIPSAAAAPATAALPHAAGQLGVVPDLPCPYCGEPTAQSDQHCRKCGGNLMLRLPPPPNRSIQLSIVAILWGIGAVLTTLAGIGIMLVALVLVDQLPRSLRQGGLAQFNPANVALFTGLAVFILGLLQLWITRGLWRRSRWSYYIVVFLTALQALSTGCNLLTLPATMRTFTEAVQASELPSQMSRTMTNAFWGGFICSTLLGVLYVVLVGLSYRDFFGLKVRYSPEVDAGDHMDHYNSGVAYKNRGMWYMAAKEWELAANMSPRDLSYLHALGLAYAQIRQFDRARATLDKALQLDPHHIQIKESRALVDKMAQRSA